MKKILFIVFILIIFLLGINVGSENDKTWTQVMGKLRHKFYNPIHQNYGHIKAIEEITGISKNIYSIIVFSDKAILKKVDINNILACNMI